MAGTNSPSEFGGRRGMVQDEQVGHETEIQEIWEMHATNPAKSDGEGVPDPKRVGLPNGQGRTAQ